MNIAGLGLNSNSAYFACQRLHPCAGSSADVCRPCGTKAWKKNQTAKNVVSFGRLRLALLRIKLFPGLAGTHAGYLRPTFTSSIAHTHHAVISQLVVAQLPWQKCSYQYERQLANTTRIARLASDYVISPFPRWRQRLPRSIQTSSEEAISSGSSKLLQCLANPKVAGGSWFCQTVKGKAMSGH